MRPDPITTFGHLSSASTIGGNFPSGSGGSTDHFLQQQVDNAIIDLSVIHRTGFDYTPNIRDHGHNIEYNVFGGPQIVNPDVGVSTANANRDEANFNFVVSTAGQGSHETLQHYLLDHDIILQFRQPGDPKDGGTLLHAVYDPAHATGGSPVVFADAAGHIVINDNGGNAQILANSENPAFGFLAGHILTSTQFDVDLKVIEHQKDGRHVENVVIADIHAVVQVGMPAELAV